MNNLNYLNKRQIIPLFVLNETRGFKKLIGNNHQLITNWFLEKGYYFVSLEQLYYETMSFSLPGIIELLEPKFFRERLCSDLKSSLPKTPGSYLLYFEKNGNPQYFSFQSKTHWGARKEIKEFISILPKESEIDNRVSLMDCYSQIVGVYNFPDYSYKLPEIDFTIKFDEYEFDKKILMSIIRNNCKKTIYNYDRILSIIYERLKKADVYRFNDQDDVRETVIEKLKRDYYDPGINYENIIKMIDLRRTAMIEGIFSGVPDGVRINPAIGGSAYKNPLYTFGKKKPNPEQILKQEPIIKIIFSLEQKLNEFGFDGNEIINLLPPIINRMETEIA